MRTQRFNVGTPRAAPTQPREDPPDSSTPSQDREWEDLAPAPKWNGDPDTWDQYRAEVESRLAAKKVLEAHNRMEKELDATRPVWDNDPATWEDYNARMNAWIIENRDKLDEVKRSRAERDKSAMQSGSSTPALTRARKGD